MDTLGTSADYYALHSATDGARTTLRQLYYALERHGSDPRAAGALRSLRDLCDYGTTYSNQDYDVLCNAASILRALGGAA
jgi:hypothetical protein